MPSQPTNQTGTISRRYLVGAAAASAAALAGCGGTPDPESTFIGTPAASPVPPGTRDRWQGRSITVATYGGAVEAALRTHIWEPFERATGCRIRAFANDPPRDGTPAPVAATDLVLADPMTAARFQASGQGRALDPSTFPGVPDSSGMAAAGVVPAFAYSLVDCWKRDAFPGDRTPAEWAAWWDLAATPGPRTLPRNPLGTLEIALLADGVAPDALYPIDIDRAITSLGRIAEAVGDRWWTRGVEPAGWVAADRAVLGVAWHHRVLAAQLDGRAVDFGWNQGILVTDCWLAPMDSTEPEATADLLAWTLSAESQAAFARETRMGPINPGAFAFIEPWLLDTLPTAEPQATSQIALDGRWWATYGDDAESAMAEWLAAGSAAKPVPPGAP